MTEGGGPRPFVEPQDRKILNSGLVSPFPSYVVENMALWVRTGIKLHLASFLPDRVLESEEGRREYLAFPTSKSPGAGQKGRKDLLKGNGRRIDYMLHAEEGLCPDWKAVSLRLGPVAPYSTLNPSPSPCSLKRRAIIFTA